MTGEKKKTRTILSQNEKTFEIFVGNNTVHILPLFYIRTYTLPLLFSPLHYIVQLSPFPLPFFFFLSRYSVFSTSRLFSSLLFFFIQFFSFQTFLLLLQLRTALASLLNEGTS